MTRDHKLILGGAGLGISGCLLATGVYLLGACLFGAGVMFISDAGRG